MMIRSTRHIGMLAILIAITGCEGPTRPPPPAMLIDGLPVSGSLATARNAGFTRCIAFTIDMRCRKQEVMIAGHGPYRAAVDLDGSDGGGGFDRLTLWHDLDQTAVFAVVDALERRGWRSCYRNSTRGDSGDQIIYRRQGAPVWFSMDISYWGKRRLRVIPEWNKRVPRC
jgi:hypothetical protein